MLPKVFQALAIVLALASFSGADYAKYVEHVKQLAQNETFVKMFNEHVKLFQDKNENLLGADVNPFTCDSSFAQGSASPTSVHELRPSDVNVVGALGDSITAGTGITASTVVGLLRQDRGLSWSIGGDASITTEETIPNMLKTYNPEVKGFSTGWGPVWIKSASRFNLAEPGDKSEHIFGQAERLIARMQEDKSVDFEKDWKVITIFIGGNDLCDFCNDKTKYSAESYVKNLKAGLDLLYVKMPRAFVNVVQILDIAIVKALNANFVCDTLHLFGCSCAAFPRNSEAEQEMRAETERYRTLTRELIESGDYDNKDHFTVVEQPFFTQTSPPDKPDGEPDLSYFAPDCFHLSLRGHRAASEALWNNMVEPFGKKRTKWSPGEPFECPTQEHPYFYTRKNSGQLNSTGDKDNLFASSFQQQQIEEEGDQQTGTGASSHSGLIISTSVGLGLLAVVAVALIAWRRRHRVYQEEKHLLMEQWTVKNYI